MPRRIRIETAGPRETVTAPRTEEKGVRELPRDAVRATLTFRLPEDREELDRALKGDDAAAALQAMDDYLRNRLKWEELPQDVATALQQARTRLHNEIQERGIPMW